MRMNLEKDKVTVLPLAIDEIFLGPSDACTHIEDPCANFRTDAGKHDDYFKVVYFGPCNHKRGIFELVKAMPYIKRKIPKSQLILLLRPPLKPEYTSVIKQLVNENDLQENVVFVEKKLHSQLLIKTIVACDIVILPFKYLDEEPPLSLLEAMALGKATITTSRSCIKDIVGGDRGFLLDSISPLSIANVVCDVYSNFSRRRNIEKNTRVFAKANFVSWDDLTSTVERKLLSL